MYKSFVISGIPVRSKAALTNLQYAIKICWYFYIGGLF